MSENDEQRTIADEEAESSGGDAEAVASVSEREAVAEDDVELFEDQDDDPEE